MLPESHTKKKRGKCSSAHAASVHVYSMTPSGWQEEQASGACARGTLECDSHLSGRALLCLCNKIPFLKSSLKIA